MIELAARLTPLVEELRKKKSKDHALWKPGAPQRLAQSLISILYKVIFADDAGTRTGWCCTASFCSHAGDHLYEQEHGLLSQWRGYSKDGGFCLVFDAAALWKLFEQERSSFFYLYTDVREAHYPRKGAREFESFNELLEASKVLIRDALAQDRDFSADRVLLPFLASATSFKHQGFYEEREVRLIVAAGTQLALDKMKGVPGFDAKPIKPVSEFTREDGSCRRYISFFGVDFPRLPLRRVIIGPSRKQNENFDLAAKLVGSDSCFKIGNAVFGLISLAD